MSENKLFKSSFVVINLIIIGKILAFVRDALIASKFGTSYASDIYSFSISMIFLLTTVSYGLTTTFIPIHTDYIEKKGGSERKKFTNNVINVFVVFTIILTILCIIFAKYIILIFAPGFSSNAEVYASSVKITRIMFLSLIFISLQSVITGVLQAHKKFYTPAAMSIVSNIVFILYLVLLTNKYGIVGFAVSTVIGFCAQLIINIPQYRKLGYSYRPYFDLKDESLTKLFKLMIPVIISTSVVQLNLFVNNYFATKLQEGSVAALNFANKLNTIGYEVFAIGISMVIYPTLSTFAAKENKDEYVNALLKAVNVVLLIMIPAAVGIAILRRPIISVIFKRGAFDERAVSITASALLFYCPSMVAYGLRDILNKAFYSIKDTKTPMVNSIIGILINILFSIILVKMMGVRGLTLSASLSALISTILLIRSLDKGLNGIKIGRFIESITKISICSVVMGAFIFVIKIILTNYFGDRQLSNLISIITSTILGVIIYAVCAYILKIDEYMYVVNIFKSKFNGAK